MTINVDADPRNADWPKRTWDLDIHSIEELLEYLDDRGMSVTDFKKLPVYQLAVERGEPAWLRLL